MRILFIVAALLLTAPRTMAQQEDKPFAGNFYNDEYDVFIRMDLHGAGIIVPNHEVFGELPGYMGKHRNSFYWLITAGTPSGTDHAKLDMINDYGSEDLKATFKMENDSTFVLMQESGSPLKVPNNGKWQKLPKRLEFKKRGE